MPRQISIQENNLNIELGEVEGKIIAKAMPIFNPMFTGFISMFCRLILALAALDKDKAMELRERVSQGENITNISKEIGLDLHAMVQSFDMKWPSSEEIDHILGWLE